MKSILFSIIFLAGCGAPSPEQSPYEQEETSSGGYTSSQQGSNSGQTMFAQVAVGNDSFNLLANASAYSLLLDGCVSNYSTTITEANAGLRVYKFDRGCLGKLTQFEFNGKTYTPKVGEEFTDWLADDESVFKEAGGEELRVKVVSQLSSPIAGVETISYVFGSAVDGGTDVIANGSVSDVHTVSIRNQDPPNFDVTQILLIALDANGAASFDFELTCIAPMIDGLGTSTDCSAVDLADIDYKLVEDVYGSSPTLKQLNTIFTTDGTFPAVSGDQHFVGNMGFNTTGLTSPDNLNDHRNLLLVLRASGISYQYFNIDIDTFIQP